MTQTCPQSSGSPPCVGTDPQQGQWYGALSAVMVGRGVLQRGDMWPPQVVGQGSSSGLRTLHVERPAHAEQDWGAERQHRPCRVGEGTRLGQCL